MSLSLKHIPCPAGDTCTAFQCIFGHERDKKKEEEGTPPLEAREASAEDINNDHDGPPRKRAKIEGQSRAEDVTILNPPSAVKDTNGSQNQPSRKQNQPQTLIDKRETPRTQSRPSDSNSSSSKPVPLSVTTIVPTEAASASHSPSEPSKTSKTPVKKESLNPRLLKKSPAAHPIRFKLLALLHEQFIRLNDLVKAKAKKDPKIKQFILTDQEAITLALDTEEKMAVDNPSVYTNMMKNHIQQVKRKDTLQWIQDQENRLATEVQAANDNSLSEDTKKLHTGLTLGQELALLKKIQTHIDELGQFGYVPHIPSEKDVEAARQGKEAGQGYERCARCQARFQVFPGRREEDGALTTGGSCTHHSGKQRRVSRQPGDSIEKASKIWSCCGGDIGSEGCQTHPHHVYKVENPKTLSTILKFARTPENPSAPIDRAVCLDCEMGYTTNGMETIRVTATNWQTEEVILDALVQPYGEILDCNTVFSGVRAEDLHSAKPWTPSEKASHTREENQEKTKAYSVGLRKFPNLESARDAFFNIISPKTFILGHGLENDLNTMRIVHPRIIDTILLFPARGGLPFRQALKTLMSNILGRQIQQHVDDGLGHDSAEDAIAAGHLIKWSAKNKWLALKRRGWKWDGDRLVKPASERHDSRGKSPSPESP